MTNITPSDPNSATVFVTINGLGFLTANFQQTTAQTLLELHQFSRLPADTNSNNIFVGEGFHKAQTKQTKHV
jgi:hypothetical protein